jgi:hypothetical protein
MRKFIVQQTLNASTDSKKEGELIEKDDLIRETEIHQHDVAALLHFFMRHAVFPDAKRHDWTKLEYIDEFLDNINSKLTGELKSFYDHEWWKIHITKEKHHALDYIGDESINLGDIIHMLCDWVAAGRARNADGEFKVLDYHKGPEFKEKVGPLLIAAFENTLTWLVDNTTVDSNPQSEEEDGTGRDSQTDQSYAEAVDDETYEVESQEDPEMEASDDEELREVKE